MSDKQNRYDNEYGNGLILMMGILIGTAVGVGLGMLFAPKPGRRLRRQLSARGSDLATTATEQFQRVKETAGEWAERGLDMSQEAIDAARSVVSDGIKQALSR